jgi:RHS repeat-associated protein
MPSARSNAEWIAERAVASAGLGASPHVEGAPPLTASRRWGTSSASVRRVGACWALMVLVQIGAPAPARAQGPIVEYCTLDALGSVRVVTDADGQVLRRHDYQPFGEEYNPPTGQPDKRLFTGKERDAETGLDYFGARYYRADLGRFTSVDPMQNVGSALVDPQRWNRYTYARNSPLRYTDPNGLDIVPVVLQFATGAKLTYLDTRVVNDVRAIVSEAAAHGVEFRFTSVFRTPEGQASLDTPYTKNTTGTSPHLVGLAIDIDVDHLQGTDLAGLTAIAGAHGLKPLITGQADDPPHFEARALITRGPNGKVDQAYRDMLALNQAQARFYDRLYAFTLAKPPKIVKQDISELDPLNR